MLDIIWKYSKLDGTYTKTEIKQMLVESLERFGLGQNETIL